MVRRPVELLLAVLLGFAAPSAPAAAAAAPSDAVAVWLEAQGLDELLAVHLEQQLESTVGSERDEMVLRLVGIYSGLLETVNDPAVLLALEGRSRKLLTAASADAGVELRLALIHGSYRAAEKIAESHRLRASTPQQIERAKETLAEIIPQLHGLRSRLEERIAQADRRLQRATGNEVAILTAESQRDDRLLGRCRFLNAWAQYYQSWLHDRGANARIAEQLFAELLQADSGRPDPADISVDLRADEGVARGILGMALCKSLTSTSATAIRWVDLLENPAVFAEIRDEAPAWKMAIYLEHGEYAAAEAILAKAREQKGKDEGPPLPWLRLAAVHALEGIKNNAEAAKLARLALTLLASRGELQQVLDLSQRYGTAALGQEGFAFRYVKAVQDYEAARGAHGDDEPTKAAALTAGYALAMQGFQEALAEPDTERYPQASGSCRWLIGWCLYFQSRFAEARPAFEQAADDLIAAQAAEALWMAVICLDRATPSGAEDQLNQELAAFIDVVLDRFPSSPHAPKLVLRRALASGEVSPKVVEDLLAIPPENDVYVAAQRRAAEILYRLFRGATGEPKLAYGSEYMAISLPLVGAWAELLDPTDGTALRLYLSRSRRVLEVALTPGLDRLAAAARILDDLDDLGERGGADLAVLASEIEYRRVQYLLGGAGSAAAAEVADQLWERDRDSLWARIAVRSVFDAALRRWRAAENPMLADRDDLALVVQFGRRLLGEDGGQPDMQVREGVLALQSTVAEALLRLWQRTGDQRTAAESLAVYDRVLAARPNDADSLRAVAQIATALNQTDRALDAWRTLVSGTPPGTGPWLEAKFHLIELLAATDPARARDVMDQHKTLNTGYGPEPWASRLEALDRRIPPAPAPAESDS